MVTAQTPSMLSRPTAGFNLRQDEVEKLAIGRTPALVAEFAPGLTNNTPNANQVTIGGAFAFDNVFMLDGVDINDNLIGNPDNLFIEDAVEETQVLTSGLPAEYGRFSGGVVNAVTRRGGNIFSGSVRTNLSNPAWTEETPFEKANNQTRLDKMDQYYEGVFGGPIQRDKLWFFFAGRSQTSTTDLTLAQTARAVRADRRSAPVGAQAHRHADGEPDGAGAVHQPPAVRRAAVALGHDHRPERTRHRVSAREPARAQLERRRVEPLVCDRAVLAQDQPSALRQHGDRRRSIHRS